MANATEFASAVASVVAPISLNNSDALRPSIDVPFTLKKSSSATPVVNVATLPFAIPDVGTVGICDVRASVQVVAGIVRVILPPKSE